MADTQHALLSEFKKSLRIASDVYDDELNNLLTYGTNYIKSKLNVTDEKWSALRLNNNIVDLTIILFAKQLFKNNIKDKYNNDFTPILDNLISDLLTVIERE